MATYTPGYSYASNPSPQGGSGTFGAVPGVISMPNPSADLANQIPNLGAINSSIFGNLLSQSQGQLPQADQNFSRDQSAGQAIASGMPGLQPGSLQGNSAARNLGLMQYQMQQQAAQQYPSLTGAVSQTQTVAPALQAQIAGQNALNASAPNPSQAAAYAQQLYDKYLKQVRGPGGGSTSTGTPGGGTVSLGKPLNFDYSQLGNLAGGAMGVDSSSMAGGGYGGNMDYGYGAGVDPYDPTTWGAYQGTGASDPTSDPYADASQFYDPSGTIFGGTDYSGGGDYSGGFGGDF